jgi:hypothetical protein
MARLERKHRNRKKKTASYVYEFLFNKCHAALMKIWALWFRLKWNIKEEIPAVIHERNVRAATPTLD